MHAFEKIRIIIFMACVSILYLWWIKILASPFFAWKKRKKIFSRRTALIHILAVTGFLCVLYGFFIEPFWIETNVYHIKTSKLKEGSFRIVQISDLHCEKKERNEKKVIEIVNSLQPDIIVFTGDALNTPGALDRFRSTLKNLKADIGKFAVYGNIDIWYYKTTYLFTDTGFRPLDNDSVTVEKAGCRLVISGLNCQRPNLSKALSGQNNPAAFNILLNHRPDLIEDLENSNVDLYLAGHTHGGQIALPFYGAIITFSKLGKKYESGMYNVNNTTLYVNRGIGTEGGKAPRIRFLARPEVSLFCIEPQGAGENKPVQAGFMEIFTIILIAVGLSMDALAVSIATGAAYKELKVRHTVRMAVFFGAFQAFMPLIGYMAGRCLKDIITAYDHWVAFGLLTVIGCKMIIEAFEFKQAAKSVQRDPAGLPVVLALSVATSIDALAVGVTLSLVTEHIFTAVILIGLITFVLSYAGCQLGRRVGHFFENKIEIAGGLILIAIGTKILIRHLAG